MQIRNQGKTSPIIPKQNSTRVMFCSSISACMVRRTSTLERRHIVNETHCVVLDPSLYVKKTFSLCPPKCRLVFCVPQREKETHRSIQKYYTYCRNKTNHPKKQQPTKSTCKDTSKVDNRKPREAKYSMCNHTVSWQYTLSTRATSLTESSLGGRFTVRTNQVSPSSMSLEKRVRIRPRGVVSKKCMGLRRSRENSLSWSTEAAFIVHCQHKQQSWLNMRRDMKTNNFKKHTERITAWINRRLESSVNVLSLKHKNTQWINIVALIFCLYS